MDFELDPLTDVYFVITPLTMTKTSGLLRSYSAELEPVWLKP